MVEKANGKDAAYDGLAERIARFVVDELRLHTAYNKMSESEQAPIVDRIKARARDLTIDAVTVVAAGAHAAIPVTIKTLGLKEDTIDVKVECSRHTIHRHRLTDIDYAILVLVDAAAYEGDLAAIRADPDQPGLEV